MTTKYRLKITLMICLTTFLFPMILSCASGGMVADLNLMPKNDPNAATIIVMRKSQMTGAAVRIKVYLDAKEVCYLGPGDMVKLPVLPGEHFLAAGLKDNTADSILVTINAEPEKTYYFYYNVAAGLFNFSFPYKLEQLNEIKGKEMVSSGEFDDISKTK